MNDITKGNVASGSGTKTLRLNCGENIITPAVVHTLMPFQINEQYLCHSRQPEFEPAGERSPVVPPRPVLQSIKGLDYIPAESTDAIDNLIKVVQTLVENGCVNDWDSTIIS